MEVHQNEPSYNRKQNASQSGIFHFGDYPGKEQIVQLKKDRTSVMCTLLNKKRLNSCDGQASCKLTSNHGNKSSSVSS